MEITGRKQSPIDLNNECCDVLSKDSKVSSIAIDYPAEFRNLQLTNAGLSWRVDIPNELAVSTRKSFGYQQVFNFRSAFNDD